MMDKDFKKVIKKALAQGFTHKVANNGHHIFYRNGVFAGSYAGTPGDRRAIKNCIAELRRNGYVA